MATAARPQPVTHRCTVSTGPNRWRVMPMTQAGITTRDESMTPYMAHTAPA